MRLKLICEKRDAWIGAYFGPGYWYFGGPFIILRWERTRGASARR